MAGGAVSWEIDTDGVGPIRVGNRRDVVRSALGAFRTVKGPYDPERDQFVDQGMQVVYDDESRAQEIMVDLPAQARLRSVELLGRALNEVLADLAAQSIRAVRDADGATLPDLGISLYSVNETVESVTVGYPARSKT